MDTLVQKMQAYLKETLGIDVDAIRWGVKKQLPVALQQFCSFYRMDILGTEMLLMTISGTKESSPIHARRMIELITPHWQGEVVYLLPRVTSYNRKRLIERKISFVIPGSQLYLPLCGLDLREYFERLRKPKKVFSPSTQVILLSMLYGRLAGKVSPSTLADKLGYTAMTMSRGLDELTQEGLFSQHSEWRQRVVEFDGSRRELWDAVKDRMRTPVKKRYHLLVPAGIVNSALSTAGESALFRYNMTEMPENPIYAVSGETWKKLVATDGVIELEDSEPDSVIVEVWKYAPELFSRKNLVDPISLYLSMSDRQEDSIDTALGKLIRFVEEGLRSAQGSLKTK